MNDSLKIYLAMAGNTVAASPIENGIRIWAAAATAVFMTLSIVTWYRDNRKPKPPKLPEVSE